MSRSEAIIKQVRKQCLQTWPAMSTAIMSMKAIERPGIGTISVDSSLRLYYDPEFVVSQPSHSLVGMVLRDIVKPMLRHHVRGARILDGIPEHGKELAKAFLSAASDRVAWEMIADTGYISEDFCVNNDLFVAAGIPRGSSFEHNFNKVFPWDLLDQEPKKMPSGGGGGRGGSGPQKGDNRQGSNQQGGGQQSNDKHDQDQDGKDKQGQGEPQSPPPIPKQLQQPRGSGADGQRREWEEEPIPPTPIGQPKQEVDGVSPEEVEQMAAKVFGGSGIGEEHRGCDRSVNGMHSTTARPELILARLIGNAIDTYRLGGPVRRYRRLSRRPLTTPCLRPASFRPVPDIALVIDTSGSMTAVELRTALFILDRVMKQFSLPGVRLVCADHTVESDVFVKSVKDIKLVGGGGTRMNLVIPAVINRGKKKPDAVMCITDGETPWPDQYQCKRGVQVIAAITRQRRMEGVPEWIKSVHIPVASY